MTNPMIACVDVAYRDTAAVAACVQFRSWTDDASALELVVPIAKVEPYEPGRFFRRELPCLLAVLHATDVFPEIVIIDGDVWLGHDEQPGLGAHLYDALEKQTPVVGVAKTRFFHTQDVPKVREIRRGGSQSPLFVTAAGIELHTAAQHIQEMHGPYRIPTLLRRVDQLCRGGVLPA